MPSETPTPESSPSRSPDQDRPKSPPQPLSRSPLFPLMVTLLLALIAMLIIPLFVERVSYLIARGQQKAAREELSKLTPTAFSNTSRLVAESVGPSVVYISTRGRPSASSTYPGIDEGAGQGSAVVIDPDGYLVTNFHVIANASEVMVHFSDGRRLPAEILGMDEYTDLAVLKVAATDLIAAPWGDSTSLEPGDPVWAIGSPFGLDNTITFGIISAKGRSGIGATRYQDLLQTDAAVNPGNSGGALVNANGQIVGINTAIVGEAYRGISFAIPSKMVREVFQKLRTGSQVARGWLGVRTASLAPHAAEQLGLDEPQGVVVVGVLVRSPAMEAGLRDGDVLLKWNDQTIEDPRKLSFVVAATKPDSTATVVVHRDGETITLSVQVGQLPGGIR